MPIRFRCTHCHRLLGIATRKAGTDTTCPHCGQSITVPTPADDDAQTERISVDDIDALLGFGATERIGEPATQVVAPEAPKPPPRKAVPPPLPKPTPPASESNERPLFEGDMDAILGRSVAPEDAEPLPASADRSEPLYLGDAPRVFVVGTAQAAFLIGAVVVLLGLAFAAGYFVAKG